MFFRFNNRYIWILFFWNFNWSNFTYILFEPIKVIVTCKSVFMCHISFSPIAFILQKLLLSKIFPILKRLYHTFSLIIWIYSDNVMRMQHLICEHWLCSQIKCCMRVTLRIKIRLQYSKIRQIRPMCYLYSFTESEIEIKSETVSLLWPRSQMLFFIPL